MKQPFQSSTSVDKNSAVINLIFENADVILVLVNKDAHVVRINKAGSKFFRNNHSEMIGLLGGEVFNCINAYDKDNNSVCGRSKNCDYCVIRNSIFSTINTGESLYKTEGPFEIVNNGEVIQLFLAVSTSLIQIEDEKYVLLTIDDISEQKNFFKKLEEEELKFRTIADYMYDWGYWKGKDGRFIYMSPSCEEITGYTAEEFIADPGLLVKIIHPDDQETWAAHCPDSHLYEEQNVVREIDYRILRKDGTVRYISHVCRPIFDEKNQFLGRRGSNRDITLRKQHELIIEGQNKELHEINISKDRFISILAHDLKNPFNSILGFLYMLTENIDNYSIEEIKNQLRFLNLSSKRVYELLEDLLIWVNSKYSKIPFEPKNQSFESIFEEVLQIIKPIADSKNINIQFDVDPKFKVLADKNFLKTILRNLISNSIKFSYRNERIVIGAMHDHEKTLISVADHGVGISKERQKTLFDIGKVSSTTGTAKETGTGIGLLICKELVEKHKGRIWIESEEGKGTTIYIALPNKPE